MLLDHALEHLRCAVPIPDAIRVDERHRAAHADLETIRLGAVDAGIALQPEFYQAPLQKLPRGEARFLPGALGLRLVATEKDVTPDLLDAQVVQGLAQELLGHRSRACPSAGRVSNAW